VYTWPLIAVAVAAGAQFPAVPVKLPRYSVAVSVPCSVEPFVDRTMRSFGSHRWAVELLAVPTTVTSSVSVVSGQGEALVPNVLTEVLVNCATNVYWPTVLPVKLTAVWAAVGYVPFPLTVLDVDAIATVEQSSGPYAIQLIDPGAAAPLVAPIDVYVAFVPFVPGALAALLSVAVSLNVLPTMHGLAEHVAAVTRVA